jgi:hypothetical protein
MPVLASLPIDFKQACDDKVPLGNVTKPVFFVFPASRRAADEKYPLV